MPKLSRSRGGPLRPRDSRQKNEEQAQFVLTVVLLLPRPAAPPRASRRRQPRRQRYSPPQRRAPCCDGVGKRSAKKKKEKNECLRTQQQKKRAKSEQGRGEKKKTDKKLLSLSRACFQQLVFVSRSITSSMLARLSRSRGGEGLALLARLALAHYEAAAASPLLVRGGGGGGGGESDINVGDSSTTATMATSTSSAARSFRSSSSSSAQKRIDAKQTMKTSMTNRGPLSSSYSFSSRPLNRFQPHRKTSPSASPSYSTAAPSPRKLDDIMRLDSLTDKTGEEIASIWTEVRSFFCFLFFKKEGERERKKEGKREVRLLLPFCAHVFFYFDFET